MQLENVRCAKIIFAASALRRQYLKRVSSLLPVELWFDFTVEGNESQEEEHP